MSSSAAPTLPTSEVDGTLYDQRIKLVFPNERGDLASFAGADESWWSTWLEQPVERRGHMRTYTVRDVVGTGVDTRVVVDFALHTEDGTSGPGGSWAAAAQARPPAGVSSGPGGGRTSVASSSSPGAATNLLLVGDETAVPGDLQHPRRSWTRTRAATVFLEVPDAGDMMTVPAPPGIEVIWLPRHGARTRRPPDRRGP